jgi:hypothetical protein
MVLESLYLPSQRNFTTLTAKGHTFSVPTNTQRILIPDGWSNCTTGYKTRIPEIWYWVSRYRTRKYNPEYLIALFYSSKMPIRCQRRLIWIFMVIHRWVYKVIFELKGMVGVMVSLNVHTAQHKSTRCKPGHSLYLVHQKGSLIEINSTKNRVMVI